MDFGLWRMKSEFLRTFRFSECRELICEARAVERSGGETGAWVGGAINNCGVIKIHAARIRGEGCLISHLGDACPPE